MDFNSIQSFSQLLHGYKTKMLKTFLTQKQIQSTVLNMP